MLTSPKSNILKNSGYDKKRTKIEEINPNKY
jgi:hypothetical protein